jgi:hypothetical protein
VPFNCTPSLEPGIAVLGYKNLGLGASGVSSEHVPLCQLGRQALGSGYPGKHRKGYILTLSDTGVVGNLTKAYCVKCKKSVEMKDPKKVKLKNGKPATKGSCPKCGTKVFRIGA